MSRARKPKKPHPQAVRTYRVVPNDENAADTARKQMELIGWQVVGESDVYQSDGDNTMVRMWAIPPDRQEVDSGDHQVPSGAQAA